MPCAKSRCYRPVAAVVNEKPIAVAEAPPGQGIRLAAADAMGRALRRLPLVVLQHPAKSLVAHDILGTEALAGH